MKPSSVKHHLTRRLAYVRGCLEKELPPGKASFLTGEAKALETALESMGLLDPERVEHKVSVVVEKVMPIVNGRRDRALARIDRLRLAEELVLKAIRAARVI